MDNASPVQRDGAMCSAKSAALRSKAMIRLDELSLTGTAAFERDCLSYMLGEPAGSPADAGLQDQIDDLMAELAGRDLMVACIAVGSLFDAKDAR